MLPQLFATKFIGDLMGEDKKYSVILDNPVAASGIDIMSGVVDSAKKLPDDNIATGTARLGSMAVRTAVGAPIAVAGIAGGAVVRAGQPVGDVIGAAATSVDEFTDRRIDGSKERFSALKDSVIDNTKERNPVERVIGGIGSFIGLTINGALALAGMPVKGAYAVGNALGGDLPEGKSAATTQPSPAPDKYSESLKPLSDAELSEVVAAKKAQPVAQEIEMRPITINAARLPDVSEKGYVEYSGAELRDLLAKAGFKGDKAFAQAKKELGDGMAVFDTNNNGRMDNGDLFRLSPNAVSALEQRSDKKAR